MALPPPVVVELVEHFELLPNPMTDEVKAVMDHVLDLSMDSSSTSETPSKNTIKKEMKKKQKEERRKERLLSWQIYNHKAICCK